MVFPDFIPKVRLEKEPEKRQARAEEQEEVQRYIIELKAQESFLDGKEVSLETLAERLKQASDKQKAVIRADRGLSYGRVIEVIQICNDAGIQVAVQ